MCFDREWVGLVAISLAFVAGGCAGEELENSPPSGGTAPGVGGTNESGGAGSGEGGADWGPGGSDPGSAGSANRPAARGASNVYPYSSGCGPGPYRIPAAGAATTEQIVGDRITDDGEDEVDCNVTATASGYRVRASVAEGTADFAAEVDLEPAGDGTYSGTGTVGFYDPRSGYIASEVCVFEVLANQEIGTGKAWGNFDCTQSTKEGGPGYSCNFEGSFLVENCN